MDAVVFITEQVESRGFRALAHPWRLRSPVEVTARCEPDCVQPDEMVGVTLWVEAGEAVPRGGHVIVSFPFRSTQHPLVYASEAAEIDGATPCISLSAPEGVVPEVRQDSFCRGMIVELAFVSRGLEAGERFSLTFRQVAWLAIPGYYPVDVFVKLPGREVAPVLDMPRMHTALGDVASLQVYLSPSADDAGMHFTVAAEQPQKYSHLPAPTYRGTVEIALPGKAIQHTFTPGDSGLASFTVDSVDTSAGFRVTVEDETRGLNARSNPFDSSFAPDGYNVYFGDLHLHSYESDGFTGQEQVLLNARDWMHLDFVAIQEHVEDRLASLVAWTPEKWRTIHERYERYNEPGRFVTIGGYEFRSYCNLYCSTDEYWQEWTQGLSDYSEAGIPEREAMIAEWAKRDGWLVGYHRLETLFEALGHVPTAAHLLQMSHCNRPPEIGSEMFLERGDRIGFFGATDSHWGLPAMVCPGQPREGQAGITGIFARELTRKGIFEALRARRCYATMGSRTLASFTMNDSFMGEECQLESGTKRELSIRIVGNELIESVDIVRNGNAIKTILVGQEEARIEWADTEDLHGEVFYFSRTHLKDGRMIWTSPVYSSIS